MPSHKNSTKLAEPVSHTQSLFADYLAPERLNDLVRRLDIPDTDLLTTEVNGDSAQWGKSQGSALPWDFLLSLTLFHQCTKSYQSFLMGKKVADIKYQTNLEIKTIRHLFRWVCYIKSKMFSFFEESLPTPTPQALFLLNLTAARHPVITTCRFFHLFYTLLSKKLNAFNI